jgi:hypothetical protein
MVPAEKAALHKKGWRISSLFLFLKQLVQQALQ